MSEEDAPQQNEEQKPEKKLPIKAILAVVGILVLEGGTIGVMSVLSGPRSAEGVATGAPAPVYVEINLYSGRVPNSRTGRQILLELDIYATVKEEYKTDVEDAVKKHEARLAHRLRGLVGNLSQRELDNTANPAVLQRQVHTLYEKFAKKSPEDETDRIEDIFFKKYRPIPVH